MKTSVHGGRSVGKTKLWSPKETHKKAFEENLRITGSD